MKDMTWIEAITAVLAKEGRPMHIDDIFKKYRFHRLSFCAALDNPATKVYNKYIEAMGGTLYGITTEQWLMSDGCYHNVANYEIIERNYKPLTKTVKVYGRTD